jgi:hypothetical protein
MGANTESKLKGEKTADNPAQPHIYSLILAKLNLFDTSVETL